MFHTIEQVYPAVINLCTNPLGPIACGSNSILDVKYRMRVTYAQGQET